MCVLLSLRDMQDTDMHWLAGLLEGEGSFCKAPPSQPNAVIVTVEMTDRDVIERVARLFGGSAISFCKRREERWKPSFRVTVRGSRAVSLMGMLRPLMGQRRQRQIDAAMGSWNPSERWVRRKEKPLPGPAEVSEMRKMMSVVAIAKALGCNRSHIYRLLAS